MKRSPLRRMSAKKRAENAERARLRAGTDPVCELSALAGWHRCWGPMDWHERIPRSRGGSAVDPENRVWLCRGGHDWTHANPAEATLYGLLQTAGRPSKVVARP